MSKCHGKTSRTTKGERVSIQSPSYLIWCPAPVTLLKMSSLATIMSIFASTESSRAVRLCIPLVDALNASTLEWSFVSSRSTSVRVDAALFVTVRVIVELTKVRHFEVDLLEELAPFETAGRLAPFETAGRARRPSCCDPFTSACHFKATGDSRVGAMGDETYPREVFSAYYITLASAIAFFNISSDSGESFCSFLIVDRRVGTEALTKLLSFKRNPFTSPTATSSR